MFPFFMFFAKKHVKLNSSSSEEILDSSIFYSSSYTHILEKEAGDCFSILQNCNGDVKIRYTVNFYSQVCIISGIAIKSSEINLVQQYIDAMRLTNEKCKR